jgi:hypothetical protein
MLLVLVIGRKVPSFIAVSIDIKAMLDVLFVTLFPNL